METVWKVGRREGNRIFSTLAIGWLRVEYKIGEVAKPPAGYLMGFKDPKNAMKFASDIVNWVILEGKGEVENLDLAMLPADGAFSDREYVKGFWKDPWQAMLWKCKVPPGTVFLSSFQPNTVYAEVAIRERSSDGNRVEGGR